MAGRTLQSQLISQPHPKEGTGCVKAEWHQGNRSNKQSDKSEVWTTTINYGRNAFSLENHDHVTTRLGLLPKGLNTVHASEGSWSEVLLVFQSKFTYTSPNVELSVRGGSFILLLGRRRWLGWSPWSPASPHSRGTWSYRSSVMEDAMALGIDQCPFQVCFFPPYRWVWSSISLWLWFASLSRCQTSFCVFTD